MSALGDGLLGFATGALGAAETQYQDNLAHNRKLSLEDYRLQKQKELAKFNNSLSAGLDTIKYNRGVDDAETLAEARKAEADADRAGRLEVAQERSKGTIGAATAGERSEARKQANLNLDSSALDVLDNFSTENNMGYDVGDAKGKPEVAARAMLRTAKGKSPEIQQQLEYILEQYNSNRDVISSRSSKEDIVDVYEYGAAMRLDIEGLSQGENAAGTAEDAYSGGILDQPASSIPPAAIEDLKSNPQSAAQFDEVFGAGEAAKILGR